MITFSRRQLLQHSACGFGLLALADLLAQQTKVEDASPLAERKPHYATKANRIIFLFMSGRPSHVDTFDPKPALEKNNGKPLPFEMPKLVRTRTGNLLKSPFKFSKHGKSGIEVSELFPNVAKC